MPNRFVCVELSPRRLVSADGAIEMRRHSRQHNRPFFAHRAVINRKPLDVNDYSEQHQNTTGRRDTPSRWECRGL